VRKKPRGGECGKSDGRTSFNWKNLSAYGVSVGPSNSTIISLKLDGRPVSGSTINFVPSGELFIRSRTSLPTRASVLGGRFSAVKLLLLDDTDDDLEYDILNQSSCV